MKALLSYRHMANSVKIFTTKNKSKRFKWTENFDIFGNLSKKTENKQTKYGVLPKKGKHPL